MSWHAPMWLAALLLVPMVGVAMVAAVRRRRAMRAAWASPALMPLATPARVRRRRAVAGIAVLAALALAATALARPYRVVTDRDARGTVILAIDISDSMKKTDLAPTRLAAAQEAARRFVDQAPADIRIGLVAFADTADVIVAPTTDHAVLNNALSSRFDSTRRGTVIGDAVVTSLSSLQASGALATIPATPQESAGRILLLTDGAQVGGTVQPTEGAQRAAAARVPVYTILLGDDPGLADQPTPPETLQSISTTTGGVFAQTYTTDDLQRVSADMGRIVAPAPDTQELAWIPAGAALAMLLLAGLAAVAATPRGRRPQAATAG